MQFCFYKSYQRIIRQHLYMNVKYIPMKTQNMLKDIPLKTQLYTCTPTSESPYSLHYICLIRSAILLGIELLSSFRTIGATHYHVSHTHLYISAFKHGSWLPISFFITFQKLSMEFISGEYPGRFRTIISLHSRHVLVLLELDHETSSCIRVYPICGHITHSH